MCLTSDFIIRPVSVILAVALAGEINWEASDCVGWFLYVFTDAAITFVPERQTKGLRRGIRIDGLPGVIHAKVAPRYVKEFSDAIMCRSLPKWCGLTIKPKVLS